MDPDPSDPSDSADSVLDGSDSVRNSFFFAWPYYSSGEKWKVKTKQIKNLFFFSSSAFRYYIDSYYKLIFKWLKNCKLC